MSGASRSALGAWLGVAVAAMSASTAYALGLGAMIAGLVPAGIPRKTADLHGFTSGWLDHGGVAQEAASKTKLWGNKSPHTPLLGLSRAESRLAAAPSLGDFKRVQGASLPAGGVGGRAPNNPIGAFLRLLAMGLGGSAAPAGSFGFLLVVGDALRRSRGVAATPRPLAGEQPT